MRVTRRPVRFVAVLLGVSRSKSVAKSKWRCVVGCGCWLLVVPFHSGVFVLLKSKYGYCTKMYLTVLVNCTVLVFDAWEMLASFLSGTWRGCKVLLWSLESLYGKKAERWTIALNVRLCYVLYLQGKGMMLTYFVNGEHLPASSRPPSVSVGDDRAASSTLAPLPSNANSSDADARVQTPTQSILDRRPRRVAVNSRCQCAAHLLLSERIPRASSRPPRAARIVCSTRPHKLRDLLDNLLLLKWWSSYEC